MPKFMPYRGNAAFLHEMDRDNGLPLWDDKAKLFRFETGALRHPVAGDPSMTMTAAVPTDGRERMKRVIAFWMLHNDQAADEFVARKNVLVNTVFHTSAASDAAAAELEALQKVVRKGRRKLKEAENELLRIELGAATVKDALRMKEERDASLAQAHQDRMIQQNGTKVRLKNIRI